MYMKHFLPLLLLLCGTSLPLKAQTPGTAEAPASTLALTTNLASWATLAPNLGIEYGFARRWSIAADGSWGYWGGDVGKQLLQSWSVGAGARYWLQAGRWGFRRTHIGVAVRYGKFDTKLLCDHNQRGMALLVGPTVGYRFVLPHRWQVDAGLGLGYVRTDADRYFWNSRFDRNELIDHRLLHRFGVTDLHVSIIYLIR